MFFVFFFKTYSAHLKDDLVVFELTNKQAFLKVIENGLFSYAIKKDIYMFLYDSVGLGCKEEHVDIFTMIL